MKTKIIIVVILGLIALNSVLYSSLKETKKERDRIENSLLGINQELDSVKDKNGEYHTKIESIELTKKELESTNKELVKTIDNMRLKIKNLQSINNIDIKYVIEHDTVPVYITNIINNDTTYTAEIKNQWINNTWKTTITNTDICIRDYKLQINENITTAVEYKYKGWWIFKKIKGINVHVKSENPYSKINEVKYFEIKK